MSTLRTDTIRARDPAAAVDFPVEPSFAGRSPYTRNGRDLYGAGGRVVQTIRTLRSFGAAGDGSTLDTDALQDALDSTERVLDGEGLTYRVDAELLRTSGLELRNANLVATSLPDSAALLKFAGTTGAAQTLASSYAEGVWEMTVPDGAAFADGGWAWLASTEMWSAATADNVTYGELVQVSAVVGNVLTFTGSTLLAYSTTKAATIAPVAMCKGVRLIDVNCTGPSGTGNQRGIVLDRVAGAVVQDCDMESWDHTHITVDRCARVRVRGGSGTKSGVYEGLDYGVAVLNGCYDVAVEAFAGRALRHVVTIGGSAGVSRFVDGVRCTGRELTDAGMDSHSAVHEHGFVGNELHFADNADTTIDGINVSGTNPTVTGNKVYNCKRDGVRWSPEPLTAFGGVVAATLADNQLDQPRNTGTTAGVMVLPMAVTGLREITSAIISGNQCGGFQNHTRVQSNGAAIRKVSLIGGQTTRPTRSRGVYIQAANGDIDGLEITGGHYEVDNLTTAAVVDLIGTSPSVVRNWRMTGVHLKRNGAGTVGLKLTRCATGTETGTVWDGCSVPYSVDTESTGMTFDRRSRGVYTHSVSTAYTVKPEDESLIINRAATVTLTLPDPVQYAGRTLSVKTLQAQLVISAAANVAPIGSGTAGTDILPATAGAWASLRSDGAAWVIMQRGS